MAAPAGTLIDRLARIRGENRWLRRTGAGGRAAGASIASDPVATLRAGAALNQFDVGRTQIAVEAIREARRAETIAQRALTEATKAKTEATNASRLARQAQGLGGTSAVDRMSGRRVGFGKLAARVGKGVANPLLGMQLALNSVTGRAFMYTHIAGAAMNGIVDLGLQVRRLRTETASTGEAARLAGNELAGGALSVLGVRGLASGVNRLNAIIGRGDVDQAEREFDRRWAEVFTSREAAARMGIERRKEIARIRAEADKRVAAIDAFLRDYTPETFAVATITDREIYRRDVQRENKNARDEEVREIENGVKAAVREVP